MPDAAPSVNRLRRGCSRSNDSLRFRHRPYAFDTSSVVSLRSSSCQSPDLVLSRPFPSALTTMAFVHSRRRWFGTCSCQPVPRGPPSSIRQLHTLGPPRPFALVAHNHPRSSRYGRQIALPVWCSANPSTNGSCTSWRAAGWPPLPAVSRGGDPSLRQPTLPVFVPLLDRDLKPHLDQTQHVPIYDSLGHTL